MFVAFVNAQCESAATFVPLFPPLNLVLITPGAVSPRIRILFSGLQPPNGWENCPPSVRLSVQSCSSQSPLDQPKPGSRGSTQCTGETATGGKVSYRKSEGSRTMQGLFQEHLPTFAGELSITPYDSLFLMRNIFRVLGECGSRSSVCSLVRVLESDCLALLHTQNSFKHLAQCSQLQEVSTFHDSKPLNCNLVQKMLLYVLK